MCGITGFLAHGTIWNSEEADRNLRRMVRTLKHRGPDDEGVWIDPEAYVGLGHSRLSIVDLSPGGHQPMVSADGRYVLVFNGEIYNHGELSVELKGLGCSFRSTSDTEVLLEAISHWGPVEACKRIMGMFAFAVWDRSSRCLWLGRDRIGKKPLYIYQDGKGSIAFGSELKPFWQFPGFSPEVDKSALYEFFRYSYVPDHVSIFKGVDKIMPGTLLEIRGTDRIAVHVYWQLADAVTHGVRNRMRDIDEAESRLLSLLRDATRRRMLSDVPLGAFLSGGIDSSLVVSLMQEASITKVKTFSIGFREAGFDEAPIARTIAKHLGTKHTEFYVTSKNAQDAVPRLSEIFDEPFADASQIPTYLLAQLARESVTVALTGDGGDEAFGGYLRYRNHSGLIKILYGTPRPVRHAVAGMISRIPSRVWDEIATAIPAHKRPRFMASKAAKIARAMQQDDVSERGKEFLSFWNPNDVLRNCEAAPGNDPFVIPDVLAESPSETMQFWETRHYLSGDLLTKVDRASMAASLEARSPLLDHRVVELAWQLPPDMKASQIATKRILRRLLSRYVPDNIVNLPKQGFSVPVGKWLQGGLRDWAESVFCYGRSNTAELLNWPVIDKVWGEHLDGRNGHAEKLWIALMFCAWHQRWFDATTESTLQSRAYA